MDVKWLAPSVFTVAMAAVGGVVTLVIDSVRDLETRVVVMEINLDYVTRLHEPNQYHEWASGGGR